MATTSTRFGARIPDLTDAADAHADWLSAVNTIDGLGAIFLKGTFASRPAAGSVAGKLYYATDTGALYVTDGTTWQLLNPFPTTDAAAGVGSLRTLGSGALQAVSGTDARLSDARTPLPLSVVAGSIASGAVLWSKIGSAQVATLAKVGTVGTGRSSSTPNLRAGRTLARTDFTTLLGMNEPKLLLNMAAATDSSVTGNTVTNVGTVTFTATGVEGVPNTAANFDGATMQLTVPNSLKQKYGTWGVWVKNSTRNPVLADQYIMAQWDSAGTDKSWRMMIEGATGLLRVEVSTGGGALTGNKGWSNTIIGDGRWHFCSFTWDGNKLCIYVDGVLESTETTTLNIANNNLGGPLNQPASLVVSIGANSSGVTFFCGQLDEVFITSDVLNEDQIRLLYAKKITNPLGTQPELFVLNIKKYARTKVYAATDFTTNMGLTQPLLGSNFNQAGAPSGAGFGSINPGWGATIVDDTVPDPFSGKAGNNGYWFGGAHVVQGSDTGFPTGASSKLSIGVWFKCLPQLTGSVQTLFVYGVAASNGGRMIWFDSAGTLWAGNSAQGSAAACSAQGLQDGQWHHVVSVEDPTEPTVAKRRLYVDGLLVQTSPSGTLPSISLGGALGLNVGRDLTTANYFNGHIGGVFLCGYALTADQVYELYTKVDTATVISDRQPYDPMPIIEHADSSNIYIVGDALEPTDYMELIAV